MLAKFLVLFNKRDHKYCVCRLPDYVRAKDATGPVALERYFFFFKFSEGKDLFSVFFRWST